MDVQKDLDKNVNIIFVINYNVPHFFWNGNYDFNSIEEMYSRANWFFNLKFMQLVVHVMYNIFLL